MALPSALSNDEALIWWRRVTMSLVNASVRTGNWRTALIMLEDLRKQNAPPSGAGGASAARTFAYDVEILSRIGRVRAQTVVSVSDPFAGVHPFKLN